MTADGVRNNRVACVLALIVGVGGLAVSSIAAASPEPGSDPGAPAGPSAAPLVLAAATVVQPPSPVTPIITERGRIALSVDSTGTTGTSSVVEVDKPDDGATVRAAYLAVASTGFSNYLPGTGDIELDG